MKLNVNFQYAVMYVFYLAANKNATTEEVATYLGINTRLLERVRHKLKATNIIVTKRGPRGYSRLNPKSTLLDVYTAFRTVKSKQYVGTEEAAALEFLNNSLDASITAALNITITDAAQVYMHKKLVAVAS